MPSARRLFIVVFGPSPLILVSDSLLVRGLLTACAALLVFIVALSIRPREATFLSQTDPAGSDRCRHPGGLDIDPGPLKSKSLGPPGQRLKIALAALEIFDRVATRTVSTERANNGRRLSAAHDIEECAAKRFATWMDESALCAAP